MRQVSFVYILLLGGIIAGASLNCFPMDSDSTPLLNSFPIATQPGVALKLVCQYEESGNCTYVGGSMVAGKSSCPGGLSSAGTVNNPGIKSTTGIFPSKTLSTFPTTTATETSSSNNTSRSVPVGSTLSPSDSKSAPASASAPTSDVVTTLMHWETEYYSPRVSSLSTKSAAAFASAPTSDVVTTVSSLSTSFASATRGTSTGGQTSVLGARKSSIPGGVFAGIAVVIVIALAFVCCVVFICRRRIRNRVRVDAVFHAELTAGRRAVTEKTRGFRTSWEISVTQAPDARSNISSLSADIRQEYLRNRMLAAQRQLDALPDVVGLSSPATDHSVLSDEGGTGTLDQTQQIQALQMQIHTLKLQLQSQWALGLSDDPPPGYLE
ncbi:hypothetical protein DFH09DRAFT_407253 [Mycena vulgaris]|nr:hypothetical protein DFH09DRAFT_407253 [Mycena vulgaris]